VCRESGVTYNFDADSWYENQVLLIRSLHEQGQLSDAEFEAKMAEIEQRYESMLDRLDGSYTIPSNSG
jgi:mannitol/fructose-specific phosphotransferase system IIA component (Ntr-type)